MISQQQVEAKIKDWSLKEKIGQLFILAFPGKEAQIVETMIKEYNLGGCYLSQDNAETFAEAQTLNRNLDQLVKDNNRLPLLTGVDQEGAWGVLVEESTTGPGNLALGVSDSTQRTTDMYKVCADEMRHAGFNCILGPCCDVNLNPDSPIIDTRSFGDQPAKVSAHSAAAVKGLNNGAVISCAKHFPGHGDTHGDTHRDIPRVDKSYDELRENDLAPFQAAINAGVDLIMTSHILYPQLDAISPATLSSTILQSVLRQDMGFDGIIISDSMNMGAIQNHYQPVQAAIQAMKAGITMIMLSEEHYDHSDAYLDKQLSMIHGLINAVETAELSETVIDEALKRVVRFKMEKLLPLSRYDEVDFSLNQEVALDASLKGVRWERGGVVLVDQPVYLYNATPETSYSNLMNPRGIGPNQSIAAYDLFASELKREYLNVIEIKEDDFDKANDGLLIVVTENHPLPGEDFDQVLAKERVKQLSRDFEELVVVALRSPYDLLKYPDVKHYLSTHSPRPDAARAAVSILLGKHAAALGRAVVHVS